MFQYEIIGKLFWRNVLVSHVVPKVYSSAYNPHCCISWLSYQTAVYRIKAESLVALEVTAGLSSNFTVSFLYPMSSLQPYQLILEYRTFIFLVYSVVFTSFHFYPVSKYVFYESYEKGYNRFCFGFNPNFTFR